MALLVPVIKSNYSLYSRPSKGYPTPLPKSNYSLNHYGQQQKQAMFDPSQRAYFAPNNISQQRKLNSDYYKNYSNKHHNTSSSSSSSIVGDSNKIYKTPTTVVLNGVMPNSYNSKNYNSSYNSSSKNQLLLPPNIVLSYKNTSQKCNTGVIIQPYPNSSITPNVNGNGRRFRSLSERSRVITPMPIIFEDERLGSGPEMLFHPHTAPPVRKTRKSKSFPNDEHSIKSTSNSGKRNEISGYYKKFFTQKKSKTDKPKIQPRPDSESDYWCPLTTASKKWYSLLNNGAILSPKSCDNKKSAVSISKCTCEACVCGCNGSRKRRKLFTRIKNCQSNEIITSNIINSDTDELIHKPIHRHRAGCFKVNKSSSKSSTDINNNDIDQINQPAGEPLLEISKNTCGVHIIPPDSILKERLSLPSKKFSTTSSSSDSYSTPSPSPPNHSPLNSEIALAGKYAFAQLCQHNQFSKHKSQHQNNNLINNLAKINSPNVTPTSSNNMVMLIKTISEKLSLKIHNLDPSEISSQANEEYQAFVTSCEVEENDVTLTKGLINNCNTPASIINDLSQIFINDHIICSNAKLQATDTPSNKLLRPNELQFKKKEHIKDIDHGMLNSSNHINSIKRLKNSIFNNTNSPLLSTSSLTKNDKSLTTPKDEKVTFFKRFRTISR
ncbi:unnamed protein product [Gordionus sp. m RMFG-2023]|uniref:uncharacterized protein LOC135929656 n=1 Tax=Gordionus sp. m RMFG-2023 TaxID=3053472 RepID=UPI0030E53A45